MWWKTQKTLWYVSLTELDNVHQVGFREPIHLCTCMCEWGGGERGGYGFRSAISDEVTSLISYTLRYVSLAEFLVRFVYYESELSEQWSKPLKKGRVYFGHSTNCSVCSTNSFQEWAVGAIVKNYHHKHSFFCCLGAVTNVFLWKAHEKREQFRGLWGYDEEEENEQDDKNLDELRKRGVGIYVYNLGKLVPTILLHLISRPSQWTARQGTTYGDLKWNIRTMRIANNHQRYWILIILQVQGQNNRDWERCCPQAACGWWTEPPHSRISHYNKGYFSTYSPEIRLGLWASMLPNVSKVDTPAAGVYITHLACVSVHTPRTQLCLYSNTNCEVCVCCVCVCMCVCMCVHECGCVCVCV